MTPQGRATNDGNAAGSSGRGEPAFLAVGRLRRPHGLKGEMQMDVLTDFPERLKKGLKVYVGPEYTLHTFRSIRPQPPMLLVAFEGLDSPEAIGDLRNRLVFVSVESLPPLEEGEYYHHELLGLTVVDEEGQVLGLLTDILETGANDVYIVQPESGPEILLPGTDEVILEIDLSARQMKVHLLPGLLNE
jgi:16S rRNA processing protein RimM